MKYFYSWWNPILLTFFDIEWRKSYSGYALSSPLFDGFERQIGKFFDIFFDFWHFLKKKVFFIKIRKNVKIAYQIIFKFSINYPMIYFFYAYKKHFIFWLFKWKFKGNFLSSFDIFSRKCVFFRPLFESFLESLFWVNLNGEINI